MQTKCCWWKPTDPTSGNAIGTGLKWEWNFMTNDAYCLANIKWYSKVGINTGNTTSDGVFIYTGLLTDLEYFSKSTRCTAVDWYIFDYKRNGTEMLLLKIQQQKARASAGDTEAFDGYYLDIISNGFKIRTSHQALNLPQGLICLLW